MTSNAEMKFTYTNNENREAAKLLRAMLRDGGVRTFHSGLLTSLGYYTGEKYKGGVFWVFCRGRSPRTSSFSVEGRLPGHLLDGRKKGTPPGRGRQGRGGQKLSQERRRGRG